MFLFGIVLNFSKKLIKSLVAEIFGVNVINLNTYIVRGKKRRFGKFVGYKLSSKRVILTLLRDFHILFVFLFRWKK